MSSYGIVVEKDGEKSVSFHVGWIGVDPSHAACGKSVEGFKDWGIVYSADDLHLAIGGKVCEDCQEAARKHAADRALKEKK